jgi:hypothetical protein
MKKERNKSKKCKKEEGRYQCKENKNKENRSKNNKKRKF